MPRTERDVKLQQHIWHDLHERGESASAARTAEYYLQKINTKGFSDLSVAENHDEYARMVVVCALSAAIRQGAHLPLAMQYLRMATRTVFRAYPLAATRSQAEIRNIYWEPVYGDLNAQRECIVDVIKLLDHLAPLFFDGEHEQFLHVRLQLSQLLKEEQRDRILTVSQASGRVRSSILSGEIFKDSRASVELFKRFAKVSKKSAVYRLWRSDVTKRGKAYDLDYLKSLLALKFVGLGDGNVYELDAE